MIRFALKCDNGHQFESWFRSGDAFSDLKARGKVECPTCRSSRVEKSLMAPGIAPCADDAAQPGAERAMAVAPDPELARAIAKLRDYVEKNSEYVGRRFADEATAMHLGDVPHRSIHGEVGPDEARRLAETGVPAVPLPFIPRHKTN